MIAVTVLDIVIDPDPFAIAIPDPAVNVDRASPVPVPINSLPFAAVDVLSPVPPLDGPNKPPSVTTPVVAIVGVNPDNVV